MTQKICEVSYSVQIDAEAQDVWHKVCQDCSILEWNDTYVAECTTSVTEQGQIVRNYTMQPIGEIVPKMVETELLRSDGIMTITYMVKMSVLPIADYVAQILITPTDRGCEATIRSRFIDTNPAMDAEVLVHNFYKAGLDKLAILMAR